MKIVDNKQGRVFSYLRFSSDQQQWGDSERRQEQLAKDWCARRGLSLASDTFADRGVSGWQGKNRTEGALAALLKLAKPGDRILVEDQDRFSREPITKSLPALEHIVASGITVIFLKTNTEVTAQNFHDPTVLYTNFFQFALGSAENAKKSYRLKESWKARKAKLQSGKAIHHKLPSWLVWDDKLDQPVPVPEKVAVVKQIFAWCLEGLGIHAIANKLNETGVANISGSVGLACSQPPAAANLNAASGAKPLAAFSGYLLIFNRSNNSHSDSIPRFCVRLVVVVP